MKSFFFFMACLCSFSLFAQTVYNLPYSNDFNAYVTQQDFEADWSYENNPIDASAGIWLFDSSAYFGFNNSNCPLYFTTSSSDGDDWLFSPGFNLSSVNQYNLSFLYAAAFNGYTEKMKVYIGASDTSTAMTQLLFDFTSITSATFTLKNIPFTVPADGVYYFGFLAQSIAGNFGIIIDNFALDVASAIPSSDFASIRIFPNPVSDQLFIDAPAECEYCIHDAEARMICSGSCNNALSPIQLGGFLPGLYFLTITDGQQSVQFQLLRP